MRILALDVGVTTGWAVYDTEAKDLYTGTFLKMDRLEFLLEDHKPDIVLVERLVVRTLAFVQEAVENYGVAKYLLKQLKYAVQLRIPGFMKFAYAAHGKLLGTVGRTQHEKDATAHIITYLGVDFDGTFSSMHLR
jgi:hypothetical protein